MPISATSPMVAVNESVVAGHEQRADQAARDTERNHARDDQHRAEAAELEDQHGEDAEHGDEHRGADAAEALLLRLELSPPARIAVPRRQLTASQRACRTSCVTCAGVVRRFVV